MSTDTLTVQLADRNSLMPCSECSRRGQWLVEYPVMSRFLLPEYAATRLACDRHLHRICLDSLVARHRQEVDNGEAAIDREVAMCTNEERERL